VAVDLRGRFGAIAAAIAASLLGAPAALATSVGNEPSPAQAITELNAWRAQLGETAVSTTDVPQWDAGCAHHDTYMQDNGGLVHPESPTAPGYTPDGAIAGPDSVLAEAVSGPNPTPEPALLPAADWDGAVFHRVAVLEPRLSQIGFATETFGPSAGAYTSWSCLWDQNIENPPYAGVSAIDNSATKPADLTLYPSPANGATDVPTAFPGGESPDPTTETGVNGATLGWLINVEINGPWADGGDGGIVWSHGVTATLEPDGTSSQVPIVVSQCGSTHCASSAGACLAPSTALGCYFGGGFGIFPLQPLRPDTMYRVTAAGSIGDTNVDPAFDKAFSTSWCFSTGPTYTPSADCAPAGGNGGQEAGAWPLTVSVTGQGTVSGGGLFCPGTCAEGMASGTSVTLTETPGTGQTFRGWSGGTCSGVVTTCQVIADAAANVTATFAPVGGGGYAGKPTARGSFSLGTKHSKLSFTLHAGTNAPPIKSFVIKLPRGLSFSTKSSALKKGLHLAGKFKATIHGSALTITLSSPERQVTVTISSPLLKVARSVFHKRNLRLTITVKITDSAGRTTTLRLG
jgi:hypothetical protein